MSENEPPDEDTDAHAIDAVLSQASKANPCVVVMSGAATGRVFRLTGQMIVGRGPEAQIRLEDEGISRQHLRLTVVALNAVEAKDLGSTNGTYCNGERADTRILLPGDRLQIGPVALLKFQYQDELEETVLARLYEAATRDPLTQAHHRKFVEDALEKDFAFFARHGTPVSVLMIDVDHFEQIKTREGAPAADRLLQRVAAVIAKLLGTGDLLARSAEATFCVALRRTSLADSVRSAERIRAEVSEFRFAEGGRLIPVSVSIGLASLGKEKKHASVAALLSAATSAAAEAGRRGHNRLWSSEVLADTPAHLHASARERRTQVRLAAPLNARIVSAGQEVEFPIRDVSVSGIYLFAKVAPAAVGALVTLKLALTAGIKAITLDAEVVRISSDDKGGVRGMALEFQHLTSVQHTQLLDLLDRAMAGKGTASRAFPRVYPLLEIRCRDTSEFRAVLRDIGEGGVGLVVDRNLALDTELQISIDRPHAPPIELKGWPVSIEPVADQPGWFRAGVRFSRLSAELRGELQRLLKALYRR